MMKGKVNAKQRKVNTKTALGFTAQTIGNKIVIKKSEWYEWLLRVNWLQQ